MTPERAGRFGQVADSSRRPYNALREWGRFVQVVINGQPEDIGNPETLGELLRSRDAVPQRVAVEINSELITRDEYDTTKLAEGDHLEIVTFVGGG